MKKNRMELVLVVDRNEDISGPEYDTIGRLSSIYKKQQANEGEVVITTMLFDGKYKHLHDRIDIKAVSPLTKKDYYLKGSTIKKVKKAQKFSTEDYRAEKLMVMIIADGYDNESQVYNFDRIKKKHKTAKRNIRLGICIFWRQHGCDT